jgi:hypothetical protein
MKLMTNDNLEASIFMLNAVRNSKQPNTEYATKLERQIKRHVKALRDFAIKTPDSYVAEMMQIQAHEIETRI